MAKLIKIDRNGSKHYEGLVTCDRCGGLGLFAIGTNNGQPVITTVDDGICHKCFGAGKVMGKWIERTPEYQAKLDAKRAERQAQKDAEREAQRKAEYEERKAQSYERNGFNSDGMTYIVLGDTYSRKDEIKDAGGKFDFALGWHFPNPVEGYETLGVSVDEVATVNGWGNVEITATRKNIEDRKRMTELELHPSASEYVGKVGDKLKFKARFLHSAWYEVKSFAGYGKETMYIHNFEDESGNVFVWKTGNGLGGIEQGAEVEVAGAVKEHSEYDGIKQTVLTRCRVKAG